jgi:hypothetical protein
LREQDFNVNNNPYRQPLPRKKKEPLNVLLWWAGTLGVLVAAAELFSVFTMGIHLNGKEAAPYMRDVAEQLKTEPDWRLVSDSETLHTGSYCLVPACPELNQKWDLGMDSISCPELHQLLTDSGYEVITRRSSFTPEANEQAENCAQKAMNAVSSDAEAAGGLVRIEVVVFPPSDHPTSKRKHYELTLRVIK